MNDAQNDPVTDQAVDVEALDDSTPEEPQKGTLTESAEFLQWRTSFLTERIPSLFLDKSLKILQANESFCRMFGCGDDVAGQYFTRFYSSFFDDRRSSELFRAILSPATGFMWNGRVERSGADQLLNVSKIWVLPVSSAAQIGNVAVQAIGQQPRAFCAVCLDISTEYRQLLQNTFASLLQAARLKDNDTGFHVERVNLYARALAEDLHGRPEAPEVDQQFVQSVAQVAALHDVGKIGTPDDILNKAGSLESWEWAVMKEHTKNGAYILTTYPNPMASEIALRHHERWDGTGYPHGLNEELIPLSARIVAISDVYDALRMRRPYKEAFSHEKAVETIQAESGSHFDPYLAERFLAIAERFDEIFNGLGDSR